MDMTTQHTEDFKKDAVKYWKAYQELGIAKCVKNLGIGKSTLSSWGKAYAENDGTVPTRERENYESDEAKEISRLHKELMDTKDALDILKFDPEEPDGVWCLDITYIWTIEGFVYLISIIDLFSRKIIAWVLKDTLEAK